MALGETAIHTSPPHHCERLRSLLHTRPSSFPFVSSLLTRFLCFPFIFVTILIVVGAGSIAGTFYCSVCLLSTGSVILIGFYFIFIFLVTYAHAWIHECEESPPGSAHPS